MNPAPPGWYPDPVAGRVRWWDGWAWHDPPPDAAHGSFPGGALPTKERARPRSLRTGWILAAVLAALCILATIAIVVTAGLLPTSDDDQDRLAARLLTAADLGPDWSTYDTRALQRADPLTQAVGPDPALLVCPDEREAFRDDYQRENEQMASGDAIGAVTTLGRRSHPGGVQQVVYDFGDQHEAERQRDALAGWFSCEATWEVTGDDGTRFQLSTAPAAIDGLGPDVVAGRLTVVQLDDDRATSNPGARSSGGPLSDGTFTYVVRRDGSTLMSIGFGGLTPGEQRQVWDIAAQKMFG